MPTNFPILERAKWVTEKMVWEDGRTRAFVKEETISLGRNSFEAFLFPSLLRVLAFLR
jgi:hypothetical protein